MSREQIPVPDVFSPPGIINDEILSLDEAAELIGIHYQTLRSWIQEGGNSRGIPYSQHGKNGKYSFSKIALLSWHYKQCVTNGERQSITGL